MRLIDADELKTAFPARENSTPVLIASVRATINHMPTIELERMRGKWIAVTEDGDVYKRICSCCGQEAFFQNDDPDELYDGGRYELSDFCRNCGADMRGEQDE